MTMQPTNKRKSHRDRTPGFKGVRIGMTLSYRVQNEQASFFNRFLQLC
jgi:hypothetical protein